MDLIRELVSGSRVRTDNLDLTYITPRIIAMGFPAETLWESAYRNQISRVAEHLNKHHGDNYKVFNLTERLYDGTKFGNRVSNFGFRDHHAPPLSLVWEVVCEIEQWLTSNPRNVVAIHCMAGKGRTGVIVASYLLFKFSETDLASFLNSALTTKPPHTPLTDKPETDYVSLFTASRVQLPESETTAAQRAASLALQLFAVKRCTQGNGVQVPSQTRSVHAFAEFVNIYCQVSPAAALELILEPRTICIDSIMIRSPNASDAKLNQQDFVVQLVDLSTQEIATKAAPVLWNSSWIDTSSRSMPQEKNIEWNPNGNAEFPIDQVTKGDILLQVLNRNSFDSKTPFARYYFHTSFIESYEPSNDNENFTGQHTMFVDKSELDIACDTCEIPGNFGITLQFSNTRASQQQITLQKRNNIVIMGWLCKLGGVVQNWKRRWVVVTHDTSAKSLILLYFKSPDDCVPIAQLDLGEYSAHLNAYDHLLMDNQRSPVGNPVGNSVRSKKDSTKVLQRPNLVDSIASSAEKIPRNNYIWEFHLMSKSGKRNYHFKASNKLDRDLWLSHLQHAISTIH